MKNLKQFFGIFFGILILLFISACKTKTDTSKIIKIGATPVPHAEILEVIKPILKKEGYELVIVPYTDYVTPNLALLDRSIDANFFQHKPYLEKFNADKKTNLSVLASVSLEPLSIFSDKIKSIGELKNGDSISLPNDPSNLARALILLNQLQVIKLKDPNNLVSGIQDIISNPKKLKFIPQEAALLSKTYQDKNITIAIINGNYALQANLKNPIAQESKDSPYANIIAIRNDEKDLPKIKALHKAIQSQEVKKFILEKYQGSVIPAF